MNNAGTATKIGFCIGRSVAAAFAVALACGAAAAGPAVYHASDPVAPNQTVIVTGDGFGESAQAEVTLLPDVPPGEPAEKVGDRAGSSLAAPVAQASDQCVKFIVPATLQPGVYRWRIKQPDGEVGGYLNRPALWWIQGDAGTQATPGGWVRVFGKNLLLTADVAARGAGRLFLRGADQSIALNGQGTAWDQQIRLPDTLPEGIYNFWAHNGHGGLAGWSEPLGMCVVRRKPWPQTQFDVVTAGADPTGQRDSTAVLESVLAKAAETGGGVVYFPRGRYRLSAGLKIPRFTVLQGQQEDLVCLFWTEMEEVPEALVQGTNSFGLEKLTIYTNRYKHVIAGDLGSVPAAGNVFLRHVRVRASLYRGHPTPDEVDQRFRQALRSSTGGGDTVRLGGHNVEISDCDLYGAGRVLFLSRASGAVVARNRLYNGRWGWYCISGSDGLVFEHNQLTGADLMSTGGGLNCLDGSNASENIFLAHNSMGLAHGWDREIMTTDAGGEAYRGPVAAAGTQITLPADPLPRWKDRDWKGAAAMILAGPGAGQCRRVVRAAGRTVEIDRPWTTPPGDQSFLSISMFQGHYLIVDNQFADCGAVQFYGTSIECVMAGNSGTRMQGFRGLGLDYHGLQPSWYCQFLGNRLLEGNYYHWTSAAEAFVQVLGNPGRNFPGAMNCGSVVRGNRLESNAHIDVRGALRDAVVEANRVAAADQGVFVSQACRGVLVRDNQFDDVTTPLSDEPTNRRLAQEKMQKFLGRAEPVAVWNFDQQEGRRFSDNSGNGFHAIATPQGASLAPGRVGKALRLDGKSWLRVEEPAVFNAPHLTVSLWVKPAVVRGRYGLVAKRLDGACPWIVSQNGDKIGFEATEESGGKWSFNFTSPAVLKVDAWTHVAVVIQQGRGVMLYIDGREVARKENPAVRFTNDAPLLIGREAWGGDPPSTKQPGLFAGLIDELKIWTRPLGPEEIRSLASEP